MLLIPLEGYLNYLAGDDGNIYSRQSDGYRMLKASSCGKNKQYRKVNLSQDGVKKTCLVHVLINQAFHGSKPIGQYETSHINGDSSDNRPSNLVWETPSQNNFRKIGHGTLLRGCNHPRSVLTEEQLSLIRLRLANGVKQRDIAEELGVTKQLVSDIKRGNKYSDF